MLKVTGRVMLTAGSFLPFSVFAADDSGPGERKAEPPLSLEELSLYTPAAPLHGAGRAEPAAGQLEEKVAAVRTLAEPYATYCGETLAKAQLVIQKVVQVGNDMFVYLQNPPKDFYPRAGIISVAGVVGLFLARGSRVKKLVYPAGFVTLSASLYYPEQAAAVARSAGDSVYDAAVRSYAAVEKILKPRIEEKTSGRK